MDTRDYTRYRPLMFSIAYRMTGSVSDAEDIVQEAFVRLAGGAEASLPKSFAATVTTRLAIDHLRSARVRRESYIGTWLPEPLVGEADHAPGPAELAETSDSLSMAFLVLLESLPIRRSSATSAPSRRPGTFADGRTANRSVTPAGPVAS